MKPQIKQAGKKLSKARLAEVEKKFKISLPEAYRAFLLKNNGGVPEPGSVCWKGQKEPSETCTLFFSIDSGRDFDDWVAQYESMKDEIPPRLVPIAEDGGGNLFCLSVTGKDVGKMYFWDHEGAGHSDASGVSLLADSFEAFLNQFAKNPDDEEGEKEPKVWDELIEAGDHQGFLKWLNAGGQLDEMNSQGMTPIRLAVETEQYPILELLLDRGVSLVEALANAVSCCRWKVAHFVLKRAKGKKLDINLNTFTNALQDCDEASVIEAMLNAGAPLQQEHYGCNALHFATIFKANPQVVKLLLDRGAKLEQSGMSAATPGPLINAICVGSFEAAKLLLDAGADLYANPGWKTKREIQLENLLQEIEDDPKPKSGAGAGKTENEGSEQKSLGILGGNLQKAVKAGKLPQSIFAPLGEEDRDVLQAQLEREKRVNGAQPAAYYLDFPPKKLPASFKKNVIAYAAKLGQQPKKGS